MIADAVHSWLGVGLERKKLQSSALPVITGVTRNLERMILEIKKDKEEELVELIEAAQKKADVRIQPALDTVGRALFRSIFERPLWRGL